MMNKKNKLLCCDWGTSNFRLYLIDTLTQEILGQVSDTKGVAVLFKEWNSQKGQDRVLFFRQFLQKKIVELEKQLGSGLNTIPVILSGMASSSIGILEIPYNSLPFDLKQPNLGYKKIETTAVFKNDLFIFSGLQTNDDVMRGEEVQLLGLKELLPKVDCVCILPGTHSKHIWVEKGKVTTFQTFMTGEIFELLKVHSVLSNSVASFSNVETTLDFYKKGVVASTAGNILNLLFRIRTNSIIHNFSPAANRAYLSGLIIGTELKALNQHAKHIVLSSSYPLSFLYENAIQTLFPKQAFTLIPPETLETAVPKAHSYLYQFVK